MPTNRYSKIHSYNDAETYLGNKTERPCDFGNKNTRIKRENSNKIVISLYGNTIIVFNKNEDTEFPYHGIYENTATTKRIIKAFQ
jgi:hypothetical protein